MPPSEEAAPRAGVAEAPAGGRRERRRREVRDRLYETAIDLFLEQGYAQTTMDEIANRADVARTTVFNHYPRKSEFLSEWGARRRTKVAEGLRRRHLNDKPIDVILSSYMQLLAEMNEALRPEAKVMMPAALAYDNVLNDPPLARTFENYVRRAQKRNQIRDDVNPEQAGLMLAATYFATLVEWCEHDLPPFDLEEALAGVAGLMLRGIESRS